MKKVKFSIIFIMLTLLIGCALIGCANNHKEFYAINYTPETGGRVEGSVSQRVEDGKSGTVVTAIADAGYLFNGWSDGVTTASRKEEGVHSNISVKACFTKISYTATYQASEGGSIAGESIQNTAVGETTSTVTAVASEGYLFDSWSDGLQSADRQDKILDTFNVTAVFVQAKYQAEYLSWKGGHIEGLASQETAYGNFTTTVTAVAEEGYYFRDWSDGVTTATRKDLIEKDFQVTARFNLKKVTVNYLAAEGGRIETNGGYGATQTVPYWGATNPVIPVADDNYEFVMWSDGVTKQSRQDENLRGDLTVTAIFKRIEYELNYAPNKGGRVTGSLNQSVYKTENAASVTAIADQDYEFVCWSDGETTPTRTDTNVMYDIDVRATFAPIDGVTYKMLMVYVDELHAQLVTTKGETVYVDYKMSAIERQFCETLTTRLSGYLNDLFQGSVRFVIDEYFTTQPLDRSHMKRGNDGGRWTYKINADDIPEVQGILNDYRSVMTTFGMNDYNHKVHCIGGGAGAKFGFVHMESNLGSFVDDYGRLINFFDPELVNQNEFWDAMMEGYVHEFTHTVHLTYEAYDFHAALSEFSKEYGAIDSSLQVSAPYLTNTLVLGGKIVGIEPIFWSGRYTLTYTEGLNVYRFGIPIESGATIYYGDYINASYPESNQYTCEMQMIGTGIGIYGEPIMGLESWGYNVRNSDLQFIFKKIPK